MNQPPADSARPASPPSAGSRSGTHLDRGQILDATAVCLHEDGYDGTTIRRIARELNCAVGSIYRYFKDKRDLLSAVCQRRFEPVADHIEVGTPVSRTAEMYLQTASEGLETYRLMFWLATVGKTDDRPALPGIIGRIIAGWSAQMGSRSDAEALWSRLDGGLMLGRSIEDILHAEGFHMDRAATPEEQHSHHEATHAHGHEEHHGGGKMDDVTLL